MYYSDAIKQGFRIINENWQLVLIQACTMIAGFLGFFVFVGLPLAIAFIIFGLDLTELSRFRDFFSVFRDPSQFLSQYFLLVLLVAVSIFIYLGVILVLGIFTFGGAIGIIRRVLTNQAERFQIKSFLSEGKHLFFPLLGFTTIIGLFFIALAFILGIFGGSAAAIVSIAREKEVTLALFVGIFFSLVLFVVSLVLILIALTVSIYGTAVMAVKGLGPIQSVRETVSYLLRNSGAFNLYCLVFVGYVFISALILMVSYPIGYIPFAGPVIASLFKFILYIVQSYLGLVVVATVFVYYHATMNPPLISGDSMQTTDISGHQHHGSGGSPSETAPTIEE